MVGGGGPGTLVSAPCPNLDIMYADPESSTMVTGTPIPSRARAMVSPVSSGCTPSRVVSTSELGSTASAPPPSPSTGLHEPMIGLD